MLTLVDDAPLSNYALHANNIAQIITKERSEERATPLINLYLRAAGVADPALSKLKRLNATSVIWPPTLVDDSDDSLPALTGADWNAMADRVEALERDQATI